MNGSVGKVAYVAALALVIGMSVAVQRHAAEPEPGGERWKLVSSSPQTDAQKDCPEVLGPSVQGRAVVTADGRRMVATFGMTELVFEREK